MFFFFFLKLLLEQQPILHKFLVYLYMQKLFNECQLKLKVYCCQKFSIIFIKQIIKWEYFKII